jgi:hypothetical protein
MAGKKLLLKLRFLFPSKIVLPRLLGSPVFITDQLFKSSWLLGALQYLPSFILLHFAKYMWIQQARKAASLIKSIPQKPRSLPMMSFKNKHQNPSANWKG